MVTATHPVVLIVAIACGLSLVSGCDCPDGV